MKIVIDIPEQIYTDIKCGLAKGSYDMWLAVAEGQPLSENKGEWIDNGNGSYTCSNCKTEWTTSQIEKMCFCPTCGADMRGE